MYEAGVLMLHMAFSGRFPHCLEAEGKCCIWVISVGNPGLIRILSVVKQDWVCSCPWPAGESTQLY